MRQHDAWSEEVCGKVAKALEQQLRGHGLDVLTSSPQWVNGTLSIVIEINVATVGKNITVPRISHGFPVYHQYL